MKAILVHIHDDDGQDARLRLAIELARRSGGHITCLQVTPFEYYVGGDPFGGLYAYTQVIEAIRMQEKAARATIEIQLAEAGVDWDWAKCDGNVIQTIIDRSSLMDVIVLSQPAPHDASTRNPLPIIGDVALHVRTPVLMATRAQEAITADGNVVVAWNGSPESAHALRVSLGVLRLARSVHVVEVSDGKGESSAGRARAYLALHDISCDLHVWPAKGRSISEALRNAAAELDASCMVMGAYGHSRLRETVLGGVTRELIDHSKIALLLAH
jgi:nucleotide-binding universal stress UspA family protein